jgi:hypothetical protein
MSSIKIINDTLTIVGEYIDFDTYKNVTFVCNDWYKIFRRFNNLDVVLDLECYLNDCNNCVYKKCFQYLNTYDQYLCTNKYFDDYINKYSLTYLFEFKYIRKNILNDFLLVFAAYNGLSNSIDQFLGQDLKYNFIINFAIKAAIKYNHKNIALVLLNDNRFKMFEEDEEGLIKWCCKFDHMDVLTFLVNKDFINNYVDYVIIWSVINNYYFFINELFPKNTLKPHEINELVFLSKKLDHSNITEFLESHLK